MTQITAEVQPYQTVLGNFSIQSYIIGYKMKIKKILFYQQDGFRKDHRTSDHIFTLFSLINKYIKKGKYLCTFLIDFQKAYDSIRRDSLKHKLEQLRIKGKFLDITTSIYSSTNVSLFYTSYVSTYSVNL